jgi:putative MFS transporter
MNFDNLDNIQYNKFHKRLVAVAASGTFTTSFNQFIITGATFSLLSYFGTINALTISIAMFLIGSFCGALFWGRLSDILGRKYTLILDLCILAIVGILSGLINSLPELYLSRFIMGLAAGGDYPIAVSLLSEFSPKHKRGMLLSMLWSVFFVAALASVVISYILSLMFGNSEYLWRILLSVGSIPAIVGLLLRIGIPESPRWLVFKGRTEEAKDAIVKVTKDFQNQHNLKPIEYKKMGISSLFNRYKTVTIALAFVGFLPPFTGAFLGMETPYILKVMGYDNNFALIGSIFILYIPWVITSIIITSFDILDKLGRIRLVMIGIIGMGLMDLLLASSLNLDNTIAIFISFAGIASFIVIWFFVQMGWGAELYPTQIRGWGAGFNIFCNRLGAASSVIIGPYLLKIIEPSIVFIIYGILSIVASIFGFMLLRKRGNVEYKGLEEASKSTDDEQ